MVLAMAFVAIYCRLSAPHFLLLAHWATGWYAALPGHTTARFAGLRTVAGLPIRTLWLADVR